ncbi:hypothetical protein [Aureliella helgolandensis]|uniref:Uncharacterized protein n=1 Tax=Aureliella helgolandensis TaxID=2527968 RepID=A0A518G370_9BACT|nr:hypothetical protein [Aureliella helgolandensis]QDV23046.1 hypothetical protein Q31a_13410 [Aureliella helgolandensis]
MPDLDLIAPSALPQSLRELIEQAPMPGLGNGPQCPQTFASIERLQTDAGNSLRIAGLWLLAGELDRSHEISQSQPSAEGSLWHAIMHRREGDFSNSLYWYRRAGPHALYDALAEKIQAEQATLQASGLPDVHSASPEELPARLVELCQQASRHHVPWQEELERVLWWEWQLLLLASETPD